MKRKFMFLIGVFAAVHVAVCQDMHVSQFQASNLLINHALAAGINDVDVNLTYRRQWGGAKFGYESIFAAGSFSLYNQKKPNAGYLALGLLAYQNNSADKKYLQQGTQVGLVYHLKMSSYSSLSTGLYAGFYGLGSLSRDGKWGSQHDGYFFQENMPSGEVMDTYYRAFFDVGTGSVLSFYNKPSYEAKNRKKIVQLGIAAYHLNRPNLSILHSEKAVLPIRYTVFANLIIGKQTGNMEFIPSFLFQKQADFMSLIGGIDFRLKLSEKALETSGFGQINSVYTTIGLFLRHQDAFILKVDFQKKNLVFSFSHDIHTYSRRSTFNTRSSNEVTVRYVIPSKNKLR